MQAKDIDVEELRSVVECLRAGVPSSFRAALAMAELGDPRLRLPPPSVFGVAEVTGWPWKVVAAKVSKLERAGVVEGCGCGCGTWIVFVDR